MINVLIFNKYFVLYEEVTNKYIYIFNRKMKKC